MKKFILAVWVMLCTMPSTFAYAADLPSEKGIERIKWAIMSCGHMPKIMIIGLSITAAINLGHRYNRHYVQQEGNKSIIHVKAIFPAIFTL